MKSIILLFLVSLALAAIVTEDVFRQSSLEDGKADILILMKNEGDLDNLKVNGKSVEELDYITRGQVVVNQKMRIAHETQKELISLLEETGFKYQSFWVSNCIAVKQISESLINIIAKRPDVRMIQSNQEFKVPIFPEEKEIKSNTESLRNPEWNVKWIKADQVWERYNVTGSGIVVGNADTGIEFDHPALVSNYRGNLGNGSFNHNYNWFDGLRDFPSCGSCPCRGQRPCDDQGHGTHCIGTTAGGVDRKIGVAPGAKWIGCRAFSDMARRASPQTFLNCLQFFAAPTNLDGQNPNPDIRPHTTSHSYGCPTVYCPSSEFLKEAAETLKKEGVFMIVSAGNSGPSCSSVNRPPGHMASVWTVGASGTNTNDIASFSSRGPIRLDNSNRMKPEITAPGVGVWSSVTQRRYASYSGTSMASPAVNGAVALLWAAVPRLSRNIDATTAIFHKTATRMNSTACGPPNGTQNNVYGHGVINVLAAVEEGRRLFGN